MRYSVGCGISKKQTSEVRSTQVQRQTPFHMLIFSNNAWHMITKLKAVCNMVIFTMMNLMCVLPILANMSFNQQATGCKCHRAWGQGGARHC